MARSDYRIEGGRMTAQFKRVCAAMGWQIFDKPWTRVGADNVVSVGHTFIERAATGKAFYRVVQFVGEGGERALSDNYTTRELAAWFDGILAAHAILTKLHADTVRAVDSGRGNEAFAAQAIEASA